MTCHCEEVTPTHSLFSVAGVGRVQVGKLERTNPLPKGQYWIDVIGDDRSKFGEWQAENSGSLLILVSESFDSVNWPDCVAESGGLLGDCSPPRDWVKFEVLQPVPWDAKELGYPNIIGEGEHVESSGDTATNPDFGDECDIACQAERIGWVVGGVLALGVVFMLVKR